MNKFKRMMARYMKPAGEDDSGAGADRGDDFVPSDDDVIDDAAAQAKADADKAAVDAAAAAKKEEPSAEDVAKLGLAAGKKEVVVEQTDEEKAAAAAAEAEAAKGKGKDTRIPLARHTEILAKERAQREALEVELANTKKGQQLAVTNEEITKLENKVSELDEKYAKHMAEGEVKEAAAVMKEIRAAERTVIEYKADFKANASMASAIEQIRYDTAVERLEVAYPQLKPGTDEFDEGATKEVLELASAYELKGYGMTAALQKAVSILMKPATAKQEQATKVTPRVTEDDAAKATREARELEARKRNVATANAQPAALAKAGADSDAAGGALDAKTVMKMPFEKFSKLSEEDLSRMRGDIA